jgi:hypothetical protein
MDMKFIVTLITSLLVLGIALTATAQTIKTTDEISEGLACGATLRMQDLGQDAMGIKLFQNQCKTIIKKIPDASFYGGKSLVMDEVGVHMARTWKIVGEGKIEGLWGKKLKAILPENNCFLIYSLYVKDGTIDNEYPIDKKDLDYFLSTTNYLSFEGRMYTFEEYIQDHGGQGAIILQEDLELKSGQTYGVGVYSSEKSAFGDLKKFIAGGDLPNEGSTIIVFGEISYLKDTSKWGCYQI